MPWNPRLPLHTRILLTLRLHFLLALFYIFTAVDRTPRLPHQRELFFPTLDGEASLRVLVYESEDGPEPGAPAKAESGVGRATRTGPVKRPKPVHINFHGSGFIFPSLGSNHLVCTRLAHEAGCIVLDADYRKAPSHPFPAAYDDAVAVLRWVVRNERGEFDTARITVSGFSAGGNIALALVGSLQDEWAGCVKGVQVFYPPTDCSVPFSKKPAPPAGPDGPIPVGDLELMRQAYLGDWPWEKTDDTRLSPVFCPMERFPGEGRTMVLSVEYDWLDADGREFARRLEEEGREPVVRWEKGVGHGFDVFCKEGSAEMDRRDEVYDLMVALVKRAHQAGPSA